MSQFTEFQQQKFGLNENHCHYLSQGDRHFLMEAETLYHFRLLQREAALAGFSLQVVSAFRSFERQKMIWQAKAQGKRPLLDDFGQRLDASSLSSRQKFSAIIRWSAVPGMSRHHWGTDIDVFDANIKPIDEVQLTPDEVSEQGEFAGLHAWLDERINQAQSFGFYRPYQFDFGVAPERWHLSYLPKAKQFMHVHDKKALMSLWGKEDLAFSALLSQRFDDLQRQFVSVPLLNQPKWVLDAFSK